MAMTVLFSSLTPHSDLATCTCVLGMRCVRCIRQWRVTDVFGNVPRDVTLRLTLVNVTRSAASAAALPRASEFVSSNMIIPVDPTDPTVFAMADEAITAACATSKRVSLHVRVRAFATTPVDERHKPHVTVFNVTCRHSTTSPRPQPTQSHPAATHPTADHTHEPDHGFCWGSVCVPEAIEHWILFTYLSPPALAVSLFAVVFVTTVLWIA